MMLSWVKTPMLIPAPVLSPADSLSLHLLINRKKKKRTMDALKLCGWAKSAAAPSQTGNLGVISDVGIGCDKGNPRGIGPGLAGTAVLQAVALHPEVLPAGGVCRMGPGAICSYRSGR